LLKKAFLYLSPNQKPNARGKGRPHGLAEASNDVGVALTEKLGWGEKEQPMRASRLCLVDTCLTLACPCSLGLIAEIRGDVLAARRTF